MLNFMAATHVAGQTAPGGPNSPVVVVVVVAAATVDDPLRRQNSTLVAAIWLVVPKLKSNPDCVPFGGHELLEGSLSGRRRDLARVNFHSQQALCCVSGARRSAGQSSRKSAPLYTDGDGSPRPR